MKWLLAINKEVGRGSEYRAAHACMEAREVCQRNGTVCGVSVYLCVCVSLRMGVEGGELTRADFHTVYAGELQEGKYWGVEHDLSVLRGRGMHVV